MNTDIRIAVDFFAHHKTRKLKKRIGSDGILSLIQLWTYAAKIRPDGDFDGMSEEDIELAADWDGEDGAFVAALTDVGFLECVDGRFVLHDWAENNPWAVGSDSRSDTSRLSRMARSFPNEYQTLVQAGIKGISKTDYEELKLAKNPSDIVQRIINDTSTTVKRPLNDCKDGVSNRSNESNERPSPAPSPSPVLINIPPLPPPQGGACGEEGEKPSSAGRDAPAKTDAPSKGHPEWTAFLSCWELWPVKQGQEEAWREWMRLHGNGTLAPSYAIREAIAAMIASDSRWRRGKVPRMAKWLHGKGWEDQPYVEPQQPRQDTGDDLLARMDASRREAREAAERRARQNFPWGMAQ